MDKEIHEQLLFARSMTTNTKGQTLFNVLKNNFMEKRHLLSNIISAATDGALGMVQRIFKS